VLFLTDLLKLTVTTGKVGHGYWSIGQEKQWTNALVPCYLQLHRPQEAVGGTWSQEDVMDCRLGLLVVALLLILCPL